MNLFVLGWCLPSDFSARVQHSLRTTATVYPQLADGSYWTYGDGQDVVAAGLHTADRAVGPRRYLHRDRARLTFYDGVLADGSESVPLHDARLLDEHWPDLPRIAEGSFVAARLDDRPRRIALINDPLGMRPVFWAPAPGGGGSFVSNSATLLARLLDAFVLDALGASTFLSWGWAGGDRTLWRDVRVLPPGSSWTWCAGDTQTSRRTYYCPARCANRRHRRPSTRDLQTLAERLARPVRNLTRSFTDVTCGLTGGRDSRLVAAVLSHQGVTVRYQTWSSPPHESVDAHLARQVASVLGLAHEVAWQQPRLPAHWDTHVPELVLQNDGMVSLARIVMMANRPRRIEQLRLNLGALGGEVARGYYLDTLCLLPFATRRGVAGFLKRRLVDDHGGLLRADTVDLAAGHLRRFCVQMVQAGHSPADLPDVLYLYERVRRWAAAVQRATDPVSDTFEPLCSRPFVEISFRLPWWYRHGGYLPEAAIAAVAPRLASVPFDKRRAVVGRVARDLARRIAVHLLFGRTGRRQKILAVQAQRFATLLPRIRAISLDHRDSVLWELVNRSVFERATRPDAAPAERVNRAHGLCQAATLAYFVNETRTVLVANPTGEPATTTQNS